MKKDYENLFAVKDFLNNIKRLKLEYDYYKKNSAWKGDESNEVFIEAAINEPRPIRKYRVSGDLSDYLDNTNDYDYNTRKDEIIKIFNNINNNRFGLVYYPETKQKEHFVYYVDNNYIVIEAYNWKSSIQ